MIKITKEERINRLVKYLPDLTEGQIIWLERIAYQFTRPRVFYRNPTTNIILSDFILDDFGDALRIHHCFTDEPFTKDKFEYVIVNICKYYGLKAALLHESTRAADWVFSKI